MLKDEKESKHIRKKKHFDEIILLFFKKNWFKKFYT